MWFLKFAFAVLVVSSAFQFLTCGALEAAELKVGDPAPVFSAQTQKGETFDLNSRRGQWTVLYFYPKSGWPGCTKQACGFRDAIEQIRALNADVYGISANSVPDQADFHKENALNFTLIADPERKVIDLYGTKFPVFKFSKRWTFILDPDLKVQWLEKDVDPAVDAKKVTNEIQKLQASRNKVP